MVVFQIGKIVHVAPRNIVPYYYTNEIDWVSNSLRVAELANAAGASATPISQGCSRASRDSARTLSKRFSYRNGMIGGCGCAPQVMLSLDRDTGDTASAGNRPLELSMPIVSTVNSRILRAMVKSTGRIDHERKRFRVPHA